MTVFIHLYAQAMPIVIEDVRNTYQKGDMYCVMGNDRSVTKFPIMHIFRVKEYC